MNDLQQKSSSSPPCSGNGGSIIIINNNSSSSSCFAAATANSSGTFGSSLSSSPFPWGTWEDLLLASAVLKHGTGNWATVSGELQARAFLVSPSLFSAEACKCRFLTLNGRFSSCGNANSGDGKIPWFEEVRKLRVAQLKRELEHYDGSIGLLQKKLKRLKAENSGFGNSLAKDIPEQDNRPKQSSTGPDDARRPLEVCSAGDRVSIEQLPGTLCEGSLAPEVVKTCCNAASTVAWDGRGVEDTNMPSDLQELSALENANCNVLVGGAVVQSTEDLLDQQHTEAEGCHKLDGGEQLTIIGTTQEMLGAQVCLGSNLENNTGFLGREFVENEGPFQNSALPCGAEMETCKSVDTVIESVANEVPAIGAVQEVLEAEACQDSMLEMMKTGFSRSRELEDEGHVRDSDPPCSSAMVLGKPVDVDVENMEANHCQVLPMESVSLQIGSVSEEERALGTKENAFNLEGYGANAMDLLRIAYADGTPVSTPEAVDAQDVEPEEVVESDPLCSAVDFKIATHKKDLIGLNGSEVSGNDTNAAELELPEQKLTLAFESGGNEDQSLEKRAGPDLLGSLEIKTEVPNLSSALELEHLSEHSAGQQAEGMREAGMVVSLGGNLKCEDHNLEEKVGMGLLEHVAEEPYLIPSGTSPKLELESESSVGPIGAGKAASLVGPIKGSIKHEFQSLEEMAGTDLLERLENLAGESDISLDSRNVPKLEIVSEDLAGLVKENGEASQGNSLGQKFKCEDQSLAAITSLGLPPRAKELDISSNGPASKLDLVTECPVGPMDETDEASQVVSSGSPRLVELTRGSASFLSAKISNSEMTGLALVEQAKSKESIPRQGAQGSVYEADNQIQKASSCDSDGRSFIMEVVYEPISKQWEANELVCKEGVPDNLGEADNQRQRANFSNVEGRSWTIEVENETLSKQPKLEEDAVQITGGKSFLDVGQSNLSVETELKADKDVLEEDGLLVDLMKLKGTDLMNLRKRKTPLRSVNSVEASRDQGLLKERVDETVAHKQLQLSRSAREDVSETPTDVALSKEGGREKNFKIRFRSLEGFAENADQAALSSNVSNTESHDSCGGKAPAVEVFSTRRSRLKLRKLESSREVPAKPKKLKDGYALPGALKACVGKVEEVVYELGDEEGSQLENIGVISPDGKSLIRMEKITENKLLPDLLTLLECLRMISAHRFAPLFKLRPEIQGNARYKSLIKRHMDLNTVRNNLEEGKYSGNQEFFCDMLLIFSNALVFYSKESQEYGAARVLREFLIKEMERLFKKEASQRSAAISQAVKCNESKVQRDCNGSNSATTSDGKRQGSLRSSSCDRASCEADVDGEVGTNELDLVPVVAAQDYGLEKSPPDKELDGEEKDRGIKDTSKTFRRGKTRAKAQQVEDDKPDKLFGPKERVSREKHSRSLEDVHAKLPSKKELLATSQGVKRTPQISSRSSKDHAPKTEPTDNSRSSKYGSGRQAAALQGETRKSLGGGRSSRSAQKSKPIFPKGNQASSQPQKRART